MGLFSKNKHVSASRQRDFEQLYNNCSRQIYGFAMRLSGGDTWLSEEIVQTTFMRLWEHWDSLAEKDAALAYLYSTAKNTFLNYCEHEMVRYVYQEYVIQHGDEASQESEMKQDARSLETYLKELVTAMPPVRQKVFVMSRYRHMPNKEIARQLGISEKTVEVHITLALRELRNRLND